MHPTPLLLVLGFSVRVWEMEAQMEKQMGNETELRGKL